MVVSPFGSPVLHSAIVSCRHMPRGGPRTTKDYEPQTGTTALRTAAKTAPRPPTRWATSQKIPTGITDQSKARTSLVLSLPWSLASLPCTFRRRSHRLRNMYCISNT
ncbi:hypothetical protein QBC32DRAFT_266740 [Pseudoneurospora amorphoporcata]|uniref:Uncharacterized protein n=1 Tax=Pseudoneurospora amorphoporcata TaxID=241081 RepID=A0AAN6SDC9_9PEZI|nr:hypothetical protein QBC32DRAFT_266740 [Pseudoneurospora amorphoporcata]